MLLLKWIQLINITSLTIYYLKKLFVSILTQIAFDEKINYLYIISMLVGN